MELRRWAGGRPTGTRGLSVPFWSQTSSTAAEATATANTSSQHNPTLWPTARQKWLCEKGRNGERGKRMHMEWWHSVIMSWDTNSWGAALCVQIYVCVCVACWYTGQYSGTVTQSDWSSFHKQRAFPIKSRNRWLASNLVASVTIKQTAYRAGMSVHMRWYSTAVSQPISTLSW